MSYSVEQEIALKAVTLAGELCEKVRQQQGGQSISKPDSSPVTIADFGAQALICHLLNQEFPSDPIIAEESAYLLRQKDHQETLQNITEQVKAFIPETTSDKIIEWVDRGQGSMANRYWTLDPIDGTKGFVRGDQYAVALALIDKGEVVLGFMGCPALPVDFSDPNGEKGVIFLAIKGEGSYSIALKTGLKKRLSVNNITAPTLLKYIRSVETNHSDRNRQQELVNSLGITAENTQQMDSQSKYGAVARGEADLYVRIPLPQYMTRPENVWDHASGAIVVTEAGGKVSDLDGKPLDFSIAPRMIYNRGIVVSNGVCHDQILSALKLSNI